MDQPLNQPLEPLVSILVVTYNQEAYIGRTLDSLLDQACTFPYEILIGEDCSTDGTRAICEAYAKQHPHRIRLLANSSNLGLVPNYINLIHASKGRYLADCGGDDYWVATDKLSRQVALLETHSDVTMVAANWRMRFEKEGRIQLNQLNLTTDWYNKAYYGTKAVADYLNRRGYPPVVLSTACFRADQVKTLLAEHPGFFEGPDAVCEDLPLTLWLLAKGPFYLQHEEVLVYRNLTESISHTKCPYSLQKGFANKAFWQTWSLVQHLGLTPRDVKPYLKRQWADMVHAAFMTADQHWMRQQRQRLKAAGIPLSPWDALKATILSCTPVYRFIMWLYTGRFFSTQTSDSCQK